MTVPPRWVLEGHVVPLQRNGPRRTFSGRVYIDGERVASVRREGESPPAGFEDARVVDTRNSFIYPGLIDLHSHIAYNALPLWTHPSQTTPFLHHDIWPNRGSYGPKVSWPAWVHAKGAPESLMTYVQVRALAGGTTTIQGWPSTNRRPANQLVRNADDQTFDDRPDPCRTSTLVLDRSDLRSKADGLRRGSGFIYHCGEGLDTSIVTREFDDLRATNCLRENLIAIHLNAVGAAQFRQWGDQARNEGDGGPGSLVWSPFSNLWLYGDTTKVLDARANGVNVCLGTDWGPSGTKNLLGELKVARLVADDRGWDLTNFDLVEMATANPGDAMGRLWGRTVGRLQNDALADVVVIGAREDDPWDNLVAAREEDVRLVAVGGRPLYGTTTLMRAVGQGRASAVEIGRRRRRVVVTDPADKKLPLDERRKWFFSRALRNLRAVQKDPIAAVEAPFATADTVDPIVDEPPEDWLLLDLDMPGGDGISAGPPPDGVVVEFDPLPSLAHDRRWLRSVRNRGFHRGLFDGLAGFYTGN
jgi:cytosine/adenosine deaminase-related metal-dependent hydrolase